MLKESVLEKIKGMVMFDTHYLLQRSEELLSSGAIDLDSYQDDYQLPNIIYCAVLKKLAEQRTPLTPEGKKETKNLAHF